MLEFIEIINDIVKEFLIFIVLGVGGIIAGIMRQKYNSGGEKQDVMQNCLNVQNERGIRQSEALIDIAEHTDLETRRLHGEDEPKNPIKKRIERRLRDKNGNL